MNTNFHDANRMNTNFHDAARRAPVTSTGRGRAAQLRTPDARRAAIGEARRALADAERRMGGDPIARLVRSPEFRQQHQRSHDAAAQMAAMQGRRALGRFGGVWC